jgi:outer membrane protein, heavy metal efflux system
MFAHDRAGFTAAGCILAAAGAAMLAQGCNSPLDGRDRQIARDRQSTLRLPAPPSDDDPPSLTLRPHSARADDAIGLPDNAALPEYLAYAAANSAALRAAFYRWRAAVERIPQATSLPDPMVGYGYFLEEFTAREPMEQHIFELSQTFPWFGKLRLRGDAASADADAAAHQYEAIRLNLFRDIRIAWYELAQLHREIELTRENLDLLSQFEAIVRSRFRVGQATHADIVRIQLELARNEDIQQQLEAMRRPAMARLNASLNRAPDAPVPWPLPAGAVPDERLAISADELITLAASANPQLRSMASEIERERIAGDLARRDRFPDVTLGAMYALRGDDPLLARISINIPIWPEKYDAGIREANARRLAAAYTRHDEANRLGTELHETLFQHDDAHRRIELYSRTLLPKARESLQASLTAFQAGTATFLELIDSERTLIEFQLAESRARTDRAIALARLDAIVGSPVPRASDMQMNHDPAPEPPAPTTATPAPSMDPQP